MLVASSGIVRAMIALPLRGREAELGVVVALVQGLRVGRGGVILVEGWPGIGKSRFLAEAGRVGLDAGMLLAAGRADRSRPSPRWPRCCLR